MSKYQLAQEVSGAGFGLFAAVHLANHALAALGKPQWESFRQAAAAVYQHPVAELAIFACLTSHLVISALLALRRPSFLRAANLFGKNASRVEWQRLTGWFLASVTFVHAFFTRGLPVLYRLDGIGFGGLTYTLAAEPVVFYPYYVLFSLAALYHSLNTAFHAKYFARLKLALGARPTLAGPAVFATLLLLCAAAVIAGLLAMGGNFYPIDDPYANPYAQLQESFKAKLFH